jgi:glycosyltransferase involved in cell wall biosynthesis
MNKLATIISIYKNDALPQIKEMLESLYNQTYNNFDIFIQLDGIVPSEIEKYLDNELNNKKIEYLGKRNTNKGLAYSLNELLEIVLKRGYIYIFRMDADDICNQNELNCSMILWKIILILIYVVGLLKSLILILMKNNI